jgi:hypothetical protein
MPDAAAESVTLPAEAFAPFVRYSLYNSPYPAHDRGCAVDLYRDPDRDDEDAPSPVAGEVLETVSRRVPAKEYAETEDHVVLLDCGEYVARVLHVDPSVEPGERVERGDSLGRMVRSGFFAPWVDNHLHVGFRRPDQHLLRAGGSLPLELPPAVTPEPVAWDGTGRVRAVGETYVTLDSPAQGDGWTGIAADGGGVLDGGLAHYTGGGLHGGPDGPVSVLGYEVGTATDRTVVWDAFDVLVNGERVTGLSLFVAHDSPGVKVVCPGHSFSVGDRLEVTFRPSDDPIRLG